VSPRQQERVAVGYCTLYGDMCGGLAVISDVSRRRSTPSARWINDDPRELRTQRRPFPQRSIDKAAVRGIASGEDRSGQPSRPTTCSMPILREYVEQGLSRRDLHRQWDMPEGRRHDVARKVDLSES